MYWLMVSINFSIDYVLFRDLSVEGCSISYSHVIKNSCKSETYRWKLCSMLKLGSSMKDKEFQWLCLLTSKLIATSNFDSIILFEKADYY